ncbi:hypothetical protein F2P56_033564 [Juglans regia]|uniref:Uncharacterized protein n=1 Tax=Juglans regia TaxID=51240 RepID=A0A833WXK9_JUGRE|nr:hypothetical protein F2P56_033564 [Juglans regia]
MTQIGSNVGSTAKDTTVGGSREVRSPRVVRGKGRPPSLRRASRMEIDMQKAKAKTKKAPAKGKRKERDGGDTQVADRGDTPTVEVCRNLFGPAEMAVPERESVAVDVTGTQPREHFVMQSQESIQFGLDGSQPLQ